MHFLLTARPGVGSFVAQSVLHWDFMISNEPDMPFEILPADWRDLGALRRLERECFPVDAWPILDLIAVLTFPNVVRLKAVDQDQIVGFVAGEKRGKDQVGWIATIGVLPAYQRLGIATALLKICEEQLKTNRIRLSVKEGNKSAIQLYRQLDYYRVGRWAAYYQDGSDAIVFEKKLTGTL
jgi:ribosomal-protein-alanine N-acetyltransferase